MNSQCELLSIISTMAEHAGHLEAKIENGEDVDLFLLFSSIKAAKMITDEMLKEMPDCDINEVPELLIDQATIFEDRK